MEFNYRKTNKSIMAVKCIRNKQLRIIDFLCKTRFYPSKFKKDNHKTLFRNPFFNFVFMGDINTVRPASTSDYCYIEWKDDGKWSWIAMSYINAFGNKNDIKFFKKNILSFYPDINFDKINITDIIKTQNYLGEYNGYVDSDDSDDNNDNKKNKNIKSNENSDDMYDHENSDEMDENDIDDNNDNKKNKNIKSNENSDDMDYDENSDEMDENDIDDNNDKSSGNNNIKSNENNNNNIKSSQNSDDMDENDSIITCPYCKIFIFDKDHNIKEFKEHLYNNHSKINFIKTQNYLFKNNII